MTDVLLRPLADAFMQVGVFVAVLVAAFGWLRWRHGDRLVDVLERHRRWGPALGAVLGVSPGCAGAILVMPLYARGTVSFGTVIAALVATMGDSSWVIMAADPGAALRVHAILFATGLVTGYLVDAAGIAPPVRRAAPSATRPGAQPAVRPAPQPAARPSGYAVPASLAPGTALRTAPPPGGPLVPAGAGPAGALALPAVPLGAAPLAFWLLAAVGFLVAVPVVFQAVDVAVLTTALGGVDPYLAFGVAGTGAATVVFLLGRGKLVDDSLDDALTAVRSPYRDVLRHGARETSFVVVWVAVAYLAWSLVETTTGFDGTQLPLYGWAGVAAGALIGLIPGCAVQIVFTGLFVAGAVPFPTLIANAISQDGDALLPLLALERRSALLATCITTVPGLLVGGLVLLLS